MTFFNYSSAGARFSDELREGQTNVEIFPWPGVPEGGSVGVIEASGQEFQGIYPALELDAAPPDPYHRRPAADGSEGPAFSLAFVGTEYAVGAVVEKSNIWIALSLDHILALRIDEVRAYRADVMLSNAQSSLNPNWVIDISQGARLWHADIINRLHDRAQRNLDQLLRDLTADEPIDYPDGLDGQGERVWLRDWPRDVVIGGINKTTGNNQTFSLDRQQWTAVVNDISKHGDAATDAASLVVDSLEAEHAQGDRAGLIAIDIADPSWGWPPVYVGNGA